MQKRKLPVINCVNIIIIIIMVYYIYNIIVHDVYNIYTSSRVGDRSSVAYREIPFRGWDEKEGRSILYISEYTYYMTFIPIRIYGEICKISSYKYGI